MFHFKIQVCSHPKMLQILFFKWTQNTHLLIEGCLVLISGHTNFMRLHSLNAASTSATGSVENCSSYLKTALSYLDSAVPLTTF